MDVWREFWKGFISHARRRSSSLPKEEDTVPEVIKEPPMQIDGRVMTAEEFMHYVEGLEFPAPLPTRIFLHHTWKPTRADWCGHDTIMAMKGHYERQLLKDSQGRVHEGWDAGPHLFIADDGIWLFSDLRYDGVGVYGQNYRSRHIEMVGNYDDELPSGATLENTIVALGILHERLGLDINKLNFHRDFSTKTCPGRMVQKSWIIPQVTKWIEDYRQVKEDPEASLRKTLAGMIRQTLVAADPQAALAKAGIARGLVGAITQEIPMEIDDQGYIVQFFAEALIVPVNQWDKVQSLKEYEVDKAQQQGADAERPRAAGGREFVAPPSDPYDFQG